MVQDGDDALLDELKTLRKGRGVNAARIALGPRLRELAGVGDEAAGVTRRKVIGTLNRLAEPLPADLALAARAALALLPEAQQPFLAERVQWLADQLRRDVRTARRRVDLGLAAMAEQASDLPAPVAPAPSAGTDDERWYVREFRALLRLDRPTPEAMDTRVVVSTVDGLTEIDALITVPRDGPARTGPHDLLVEALYGATIVGRERVTASRFRYALRLPRPLRAGETHEYGLLFRVPPNQPMRNHYVHYAPRRCDRFELRVRFDPERVPAEVWRVDGVFPRDLDDGLPDTDAVPVDDAAEVHLVFDRLRPGFGYGAGWTPPPPYELRHEA